MTNEKIPAAVQVHLAFHVGLLTVAYGQLDGIRKARGNGHILALGLSERAEGIKNSIDKLIHIYNVAIEKGLKTEFIELVSKMDIPDFQEFGYQMTPEYFELCSVENDPTWRCCNCGEPGPHPENHCVLHACICVLRERGNHSEEQLERLYIDIDVDAFWSHVGSIIDSLGDGEYHSETGSITADLDQDS